jgi:hypothetical protein
MDSPSNIRFVCTSRILSIYSPLGLRQTASSFIRHGQPFMREQGDGGEGRQRSLGELFKGHPPIRRGE